MQSGKNGGNAGGVELFAALVGGVGDVAVTCRTTGNSEAFGAYLQAVAKFVDRACDSGGICCGDSGTDSGCWYGQCYARAGELAQQVGFVGGDKLGIEFGGNLGSDGLSGRTERVSRDVGGDSGSGLQSDVLGHGDVARGGVAAVVGGDVGAIRGKNYARNQKKRASRKARIERKSAGADLGVQDDVVREGAVPWRSARVARVKSNELASGHFSDLPVDDQRALKESYAKRLRAENELKMFKAQQQLELEKAKDLTQLKKRQETHIMRQTEVNKVQVEKAFASLARTGNVPGVVGSVETVVTDGSSSASPVFSGVGSGTISPNSSISLAEIRAIQKDALDKAQEIEKLKRRMNRLLDAMPHLKGHAFADPEAPETVDTGVTVDSNGFPIGEFGDGYDGGIREDGKWHFGQDIY